MTGIHEKPLADFRAFERWLDEKRLLASDVLYRGHSDSTWNLESTFYRNRRAQRPAQHPALDVPVATYANAAGNLQAIVETHTNHNFGDIRKSRDPFPTDDAEMSFRYAVYLRHHGFSSPLLDWSLSPYVAAYFAFGNAVASHHVQNGRERDRLRVAIYVMRAPKSPYMEHTVGKGVLPGQDTGIRYWSNAVKGETRHYDQQSAYTTAVRRCGDGGPDKPYCYTSHEYLLRTFPQELAPGTNVATRDNAIDDAICWKLTLPHDERDGVLRRLDRMNVNAYTLFRTEDALVETYGKRELRWILDAK